MTSLALGILARYDSKPTDILNRIPQSQQGTGNGILDQLGPAPAAPPAQAPAGNGVPSETGAAAPAAGQAPAAAPAAPAAPSNSVPTGQ
ncbi:preprotein translocase subunit SecG [compost metagenome]